MKIEILVSNAQEAVSEGYRHGFEDGYAAARIVVKTIADALLVQAGQDVGFDCVHALDLSKDKAREMLGTTEFELKPVNIMPAPTDSVQ